MKAGLRVVRGKDWKWNNQDGGEGHVGTVVRVQGIAGKRSIVVMWDAGQRANYRAGLENADDLRVVDNGTVGESHPSVSCDVCLTSGIHGLRWKCTTCDDFDLCNTCYVNNKHDLSHTFYRFDTNMSHCVVVPARKGSRRIQSKGTFVGAKVVRASDWSYADQDGGSGKQGEVIRIVTAKADTTSAWDSCVEVKWGNGNKNSYRRGFNGKVEVRSATPANGNFYYVDHLPHLSTYEYGILEKGDWVKLLTSALNDNDRNMMKEHIDKIGVIKTSDSATRSVALRFDSKSQYTIRNFSVLSKVRRLRKGDTVKILGNQDKVKEMQEGHGGWVDKMAQTVGQTGKVVAVDGDGDVKIKFADTTMWTFNPSCCTLLQAAPDSQNDDNDDDDDQSANIDALGVLMRAMLGISPQLQQAEIKPEQLVGEAYKGNTQKVRTILQKFPSQVNVKFQNKTALQLASHQGHVQTLNVLLEFGAKPGMQDDEGDSALHFAVHGKKAETLTQLLGKTSTSDIDIRNNKGYTALQLAVANQSIACVKVLVSSNANVNITDSDGDPAIHEAIYRTNIEIIQLLIGCGRCDYRIKNNDGLNALHFAAVRKNTLALEKLIKVAPNLVNIQMSNGSTALHVASSEGSLRVADLLVNAGKANINMQDTDSSSTPLHYAVIKGHASVVQLLVNKGADVNIEDEDGDTPLHLIFLHVLPSTHSIRNTSAPDQLSDLGNASDITKIERELPGLIKEHRNWIALGCFLAAHGGDLNRMNRQNLSPMSAIADPSTRKVLMKYDKNNSLKSESSKPKSTGVSSDTTSPQKCVVCKSNNPEIKFQPCGHAVVCSSCKRGMRQCPVCQTNIQEIFRVSMQQTTESLTRRRYETDKIDNPHIIYDEVQAEIPKSNSSQFITRVPPGPASSGPVPSGPAPSVTQSPAPVSNVTQPVTPTGPSVETVMCTRCGKAPRCVLFIPCSHSCCTGCSQALSSCHVCSGDIMQKLQLF